MNNLLKRDLELKKVALGVIMLIIGMIGLFFGPALISTFSLTVTGLFAFYYVYGKESLNELFHKPNAPIIKTIVKYFALNMFLSCATAILLQRVLNLPLQSNPVADNIHLLLIISLPINILGEELFSMYFLSTLSSKFSIPVASMLSATLFGLSHYHAYNNGNIFYTLVHILLIQGVARLIFNQAALKGNSIITSWSVHVAVDFFIMFTTLFFDSL
ncbi:CPBP family intramembrane glutamic endopeptidase [Enterococcus sp. AZ109]|uniref:CPBP family intramembrane glutamic endopeptidase n=1 Tax=Enterococcus sp. AZ109 TaxID=2774634 RepID=UPI003F289A43